MMKQKRTRNINCLQWERQQKALWAVVRGETRLGQRSVQDLGALRRREMQQGYPRLLGISTTVIRRTAGTPVADEESGSEASEWEKRKREEYFAKKVYNVGVPPPTHSIVANNVEIF